MTRDLPLILASGSASRRALLANAGIEAVSIAPNVDEDSARTAMRAERLPVRDQAMQLAEMKARKISQSHAGLVIGGDQMLALDEHGFDKPVDLQAARAHLLALSGKTHVLETALIVCEAGEPVWRHLARPRLTMRTLSERFITDYVDACGQSLLSTVGAYQLEGRGSQLFTAIEGDYFSILGLPLLPLMDYLRTRGILAS